MSNAVSDPFPDWPSSTALRQVRLRARLWRLRAPLAAGCVLLVLPALAMSLHRDLDPLLADARQAGEYLQSSLTALSARSRSESPATPPAQTVQVAVDDPSSADQRPLPPPPGPPTAADATGSSPRVDAPRSRLRLARLRPEAEQGLRREQARHHQSLGIRDGLAGHWSASAEHLRQAVELAPRDADAVYNLAVSHDRGGRPALAAAGYRQALQLAGTLAHGFDPVRVADRLQHLQLELNHGR